jgi:hypothetical protein
MIWAELCIELSVALMAGAVVMIAIMAGDAGDSSQADKKALALLRPWLSPGQAQQYDSRKHFEVIGSDTGTRYRIRHGYMMNIDQLDSAGNPPCQFLRHHAFCTACRRQGPAVARLTAHVRFEHSPKASDAGPDVTDRDQRGNSKGEAHSRSPYRPRSG